MVIPGCVSPSLHALHVSSGCCVLPERVDSSIGPDAVQLKSPKCARRPASSGLLVQTPHGVGRVLLRVNGVDISLGSTVFFTAQAGGFMTVSTLEGSALVHANGVWSAALPGTQVRVPMSEDLEPAGPPSLPEPYTFTEIAILPVSPLEREVEILPALDLPHLEVLHENILEGVLPEIGRFSAIPLDLMLPSVNSLTTPLLSTTSSVINGTLGSVNDAVDTTSEIVTDTTTAAVNTVNGTVDAAQAVVGGALPAPVAEPVNQAVDSAQQVVETTTETVNTTVETVNQTVTETTETVTEVVDTTTETVGEVVDTVQQVLPLPPLFGR